MQLRPIRITLLFLLLVSCSLRQTSYRYADWLIEYQLDRYFDLDRKQKAMAATLVDKALNDLNASVLPKVSSQLIVAAEKIKQPSLKTADINWLIGGYNDVFNLLITNVAEETAILFSILRPEQIANFEQELANQRSKFAKRLDDDEAKFQRKELSNFHRRFGRILGDVTDEQEQQIARIFEMTKTPGQLRLQVRVAMDATLIKFLKSNPSQSALIEKMQVWANDRSLMIEDSTLRGRYLQDREKMPQKLLDFAAVITPEQRPRVSTELLKLSHDLKAMSTVQF